MLLVTLNRALAVHRICVSVSAIFGTTASIMRRMALVSVELRDGYWRLTLSGDAGVLLLCARTRYEACTRDFAEIVLDPRSGAETFCSLDPTYVVNGLVFEHLDVRSC